MMRKPLPIFASAMMFSLVTTLFVMPLALADFRDSGPPLRRFDPTKDCDCLFSSIAQKEFLRDGYTKLAETYKDTLKDLGDGKVSPEWVELDPNTMDSGQTRRLSAFNVRLDEEEKDLVSKAPKPDCDMPEDAEIILKTDGRTGKPPSDEEQKAAKQHFPFEELFDAVMIHEMHHAAQFGNNNMGAKSILGKTRTPYGRALEEAEGYAIEIAELKKLAEQCKVSFEGVKLNMRSGTPPNELVITNDISGFVCGDPLSNDWTVTVRTIQSAGGTVISEQEDPPWETDCVAPGSAAAKHYEKVMLNSPQSYLGWYCLYTPGKPPKVTLRTPKLTMGMFGMDMRVDPPKDHTVDAKVEACEKERAPGEKKEDAPPVPVS